MPEDRDVPYFPGNSRTGIARVSVEDFLLWAGGGYDSTWVADEIGTDGTIVDFETRFREFYPTLDMSYEVVDNPVPDEVNASGHVGKIITSTDRWESLWSEPFVGRFDFSSGSVFRMKVYSEVAGNVYFRLEHPTRSDFAQIQIKQPLSATHQWVDMAFDFSVYEPRSDLYGKIVLYFDGGGTTAGDIWYFDDIRFASMGSTEVPEVVSNSDKSGIQVIYDYPNQQIRLYGVSEDTQYSIYSITGVKVKEGTGQVISIGEMGEGVYIIKTGKGSVKFIR